jgi:3-oxoacyl-[acyl-carrier-protein] synthase III
MNSMIKHIAYHLPDKIVDNETLVREFQEWTPDKIEKKTGIKERHVCADNETALDLAMEACRKLFCAYNKNKIDFLLLCTQSPDYFLPSSACILQDKLGLSTKTGAFDFNLGCSGFIYGLALAKGLISTGSADAVLLVTSETYSKFIHPLDKTNRTIFGDGAAATIIEKSDNNGIFEFVFGTDGSGSENLIVRNGALRNKVNPFPQDIADDQGNVRNENNLFMDGTAIFNFTIDAVPKLFNETLEKNNVTIDQIDYIIFHQANKFMLEYLRKILNVPEDKFYINLSYTGNTVSATIPIALKDCLDKQVLTQGDKILILGFGVGLSWGGTIIRI